jgi:hypothetical protein
VVLEERAAEGATPARENRAVALRPAKDGSYLEARLPPMPMPARFAAKVSFRQGDPNIASTSRSPPPASTAPPSPVAPRRTPPAARMLVPNRQRALGPPSTARRRPARGGTSAHRHPEIVEAMRAARREIASLVESGEFAAIWVPAFRAKDLALTLEPHLGHLPAEVRAAAERAVFSLVQAAWHLDAVATPAIATKSILLSPVRRALDAVGAAYAP